MEHFYSLPVFYKGEELDFKVRLVTFGYQIRWHIIVNGYEITFERDDELNFRAIAYETPLLPIDKELLEAIIGTLQQLDLLTKSNAPRTQL